MQDIADFQLPISIGLLVRLPVVQIARVVEGIGWWLVRYKPMGNRQLEIGNALVGEDRIELSPRVPRTRMLALHHTPKCFTDE